ncbi:MAG: hypothetical protein ISS53_01230 [Dehalococcoidia bacterium]|nr:hypothetical protein [Dehalococcoidia bacterium]
MGDLAYLSQELRDSKQLISAWLRLQNKRGNNRFFIEDEFPTHDWFRNLRNIGFPQTVNEKLDELLKAYAHIVKDDYAKIVKANQYPTLISDIAGKNYEEIKGLNQLLVELEYLWSVPSHPNEHIRITAKGWQRIDDLSKTSYSSDSAFIAMWYDPSLENYRESVKKAIAECGYEPIIIDEVDFNDFIMEEVIRFIRQARFLIADLTCSPEIDIQANPKVIQGVRGGVYWESGMAYGLGKTVIQTCRDDDCSRRRTHFDLDQYQTIFWKQEELTTVIRPLSNHISAPTFIERLAQRILATVGAGNYSASG